MSLDKLAEELGGVFAELAVVGAECGEEVAVNVELTDDFSLRENRNDDFGFGFNRAGQVAGILVHVIHDHSAAAGRCGAADALIQRDARVRCHASAKRAENEHVGIICVDHIEADPVVASQFFVQQRDDGVH